MGDWLGTGYIANQKRKYLSFEEARDFARDLNLKSQSEWFEFAKSGKLPNDIPTSPVQVYKNKGWINWGDWLGTGYIAARDRIYRPFEEARKFARRLNLKTQKEWFEFTKSDRMPHDIPVAPLQTYKNKGWKSMGDWLGTGYIATFSRKYRSFEEAREFARNRNLKTQKEWFEFTKSGQKPPDIPTSPVQVYKNKGWLNWGDWLGTGSIANFNKVYRSFEDAREFARNLNLKTQKEWREFTKTSKLPKDIPANPGGVYKDKGWKGTKDWLGT